MLQYMAGYDPNDPASLDVPIPQYTKGLHHGEIRGTKIGIPDYYLEGLDPEVERLFKQAISILENLGAEIRNITIPELAMSTFSGYSIVGGEASAFHHEWLKAYPGYYAADNRIFLLSGALTYAPQYVKAQQARRKIVEAFDSAFKHVDIVLGPTIPITTPAFTQNWVKQNLEVIRRCLPFTVPANLAGVPALSVPMGLDARGLPAGMQFIGQHLSEKALLQMAYAWENQ